MKLYCLSSDPNKPCHILTFKETTIMLDCGLSAQSILNFLPLPLVPNSRLNNLLNWMPRDVTDPNLDGELKECCGRVFVDSAPEFCPPQDKLIDFSEVDVILISNYLCMLALPFITEGTGFEGMVYATEPTLQIGRLFLTELVTHIEQTPKANLARHWKDHIHVLPSPLCDSQKPRGWKHVYSQKAVNDCLQRIKMVGYNEKLDVYGALEVMAVSSGFCLGSSNWVILSDFEKVAYVSSSSTLTTHPRPMDQEALMNTDMMILTGLTQTPTANPDAMLGELCYHVTTTLRVGGSVLIPCYPSGVIYDLFECLMKHLEESGLGNYQMFFLSPVADTSLAYSNILAEWLSKAKQNNVYVPEEPFPHAHLVKNGLLKHFKHIFSDGFSSEYRQPCIVFCGHPSLRFGDAVHFMEMWGSNHLNTVIFTEPDFPYLDVLAPFAPLAMKAVYCPIDTSLNFAQVNKLVKDLNPGTLIVPHCYTVAPVSATHRTDLVIAPTPERVMLTFKRDQVLTLPLKRKFARVEMVPKLAELLVPIEIRPGLALATCTAKLQLKDSKYVLMPLESPPAAKSRANEIKSKKPAAYTWGSLVVEEFLRRLSQEGITDAKVEQSPTGNAFIIHLHNEDTLIQVDDTSTHIICEGDEQLRLCLRNILLQCLNKF